MPVYAIRFGRGTARRFLAQASTQSEPHNGWRPFIWTKDLGRAEKFSDQDASQSFGLAALGHDRFEVVIAPSYGRPTDDLGGTPVADIPGLDVSTAPFAAAEPLGLKETTILSIGYGLLRRYKTVWDFRRGRIYLLKP